MNMLASERIARILEITMSNHFETSQRECADAPSVEEPTIQIPLRNSGTGPVPRLMDFPSRTADKIRFGDLDRQGHVNNSVFLTFMETGRVELLYDRAAPLTAPGSSYVIVRSVLDLRGEILWPGNISIGTRIESIGRSSVQMKQALFQEDRCVATADIVLVAVDDTTRRARPHSSFAIERFSELMAPERVVS